MKIIIDECISSSTKLPSQARFVLPENILDHAEDIMNFTMSIGTTEI
jgi:hypothetical protein